MTDFFSQYRLRRISGRKSAASKTSGQRANRGRRLSAKAAGARIPAPTVWVSYYEFCVCLLRTREKAYNLAHLSSIYV